MSVTGPALPPHARVPARKPDPSVICWNWGWKATPGLERRQELMAWPWSPSRAADFEALRVSNGWGCDQAIGDPLTRGGKRRRCPRKRIHSASR